MSIRTPLAMLVILALTACGGRDQPGERVARHPGALTNVDQLTYLGADFTKAEFHGPHLNHARLVDGMLVSWSMRALEPVLHDFSIPITHDLALSEERNRSVAAEQVHSKLPPSGLHDRLLAKPTDKQWAAEVVKDYTDEEGGYALLFVVEAVAKGTGMAAHWVVFNRASGDILLADRAVRDPSGIGVHNFYLNALKRIAKMTAESIRLAR